jgi:hypothetical protein
MQKKKKKKNGAEGMKIDEKAQNWIDSKMTAGKKIM